MDGIRLNALVIGARAAGEADKILTLFSVSGKLSAKIRGVRKAAAKLKFAAQPFCFGEFMLSRRGSSHVVTGCTPIELFSGLLTDPDRYYAGSAVIELLGAAEGGGENAPVLLVAALRALESLSMTDAQPQTVLCAFLLRALSALGYGISIEPCARCGGMLPAKVYFSPEEGGFCCGLCPGGSEVPRAVYDALRLAGAAPHDRLDRLKLSTAGLSGALKLVCGRAAQLLGTPLKSAEQLLKELP